jgi:hypothetical protein
MNLDAFTLSYIQAALWSTSDDNDEPLDGNYGVKDIAPATLEEMIADCKTFQEDNAALLTDKNCYYKQCPMLEHAGQCASIVAEGGAIRGRAATRRRATRGSGVDRPSHELATVRRGGFGGL